MLIFSSDYHTMDEFGESTEPDQETNNERQVFSLQGCAPTSRVLVLNYILFLAIIFLDH